MIIIQIITIIVIISFIVIKKKTDKKKQIKFDVNFENYTAYEQIKYFSSLNIKTLEYPFDVKMYLNYVILLHDHDEILNEISEHITYLKTKKKSDLSFVFKSKYITIESLETDFKKLTQYKQEIIETIYKIIQEDYFVAWFPNDEKIYGNKLVEILTDIDNVIKIPVPMTNSIAKLIIDDFNKN
jgi:hypothetical protein